MNRQKWKRLKTDAVIILILGELHTFKVVQASETPLAPYVTDEMATAEYWINKTPNAYNLLMTEDEIKALNEKILKTNGTTMCDLKNMPKVFDGIAMAESIGNFKSPQGYYINGEPVKEEYYEAIRKNIKNSNVTKNMELKYAFAVNETPMKAYPYSDFISDSNDDVEWDEFTNSSAVVNEPLIVYFITADKKYALVNSKTCSGFVAVNDIAICRDKTEWLEAQNMKNTLCVTGEKIYLEASAADSENSQKMLPMGTVLEIDDKYTDSVSNRIPWNNYVVLMPCRNADGSFYQKRVMIPVNRDVVKGYLPLTSAGIIKQAFKLLGNRYGWGGMLHSQDCSSMVKDVYRCFGLEIPRNTTWQAAMPVKVTDLSKMTTPEKYEELCKLTPGSILQFPGQITWFTALDKTIEVWK